jgi:hypothetical protein
MKILLRQVHSGLYVDVAGKWTGVVSEAQNFPMASHAAKFSEEHKLKDVEMVIILGNPPSESRVPIENVSVTDGPPEI